MTSTEEIFFTFDKGVLSDVPEISSGEFTLSRLENFVPIFNRLYLLRSHKNYATIEGQTVRAIAGFFDLSQGVRDNFFITDSDVYKLSPTRIGLPVRINGNIVQINGRDVNLGGVFSTTLGTYTSTNNNVISWGAWDDTSSIYFTKLGTPLTKINSNTVSEVAASFNDGIGTRKLSARYLLVHENRLFLANIQTDNGDRYRRRVQWSDLYNPEDFQIDRAKEGDFFDLENNNLDITGIHSHRGFLTVFSRQSIWRAQYIGFSKLFRFEPVRSGIGNRFHHSSISVKEVIYFIGDDNFYALDGFNTIPIGTDIWNRFVELSEDTIEDEVLTFNDPFNSEIAWRFKRTGDGRYNDYRQDQHFWLIVYNYKEGRWSFRSADGLTCSYSSPYKVRISVPSDEIPTTSDTDTRLSDGQWQFQNIPTNILIGRQGGVATYQTGEFVDFNLGALEGEIESHEIFYGSVTGSKEISQIKLSYSSEGSPDIKVSVGIRNNQSEEYTWSEEFVEQFITTENEKRFLLTNSALRGKFFKFRFKVINSPGNYVKEMNGGSLLITGMKSKGSEI